MISIIFSVLFYFFLEENRIPHDVIWVDQFNEALHQSWKGRYKNFEDYYKIITEDENRVLSAESIGSDCFIAKKIKVDIVKYPFLNWQWKVVQFPEKGDESRKENCDVPASIAVVFNKSKIFPQSIKYSWSTTLKQDSITKSPFAFWPARCDIHVVRSGESKKGEWITEKINILEDYKKFYNRLNVKSKKLEAIVIMTDSDNTNTISSACYDNIYFSSH